MSNHRQPIDEDKLREIARLRAVLTLPGMEEVGIRRGVTYRSGEDGEYGMDVYLPPEGAGDGPFPAVIFVMGYSDVGLIELMGFGVKDMASYVSWGQLVARSGIVGITYSCAAPPRDAEAVLRYVRGNAEELEVDPARIGIWAASGNGPTALSLLMSPEARLRFAVMCNTYMLDLDGDSTVAEMSAGIGFAAPNAGRSLDDLPATPMFVVRSGRDEVPGLNGTLDRFIASAIRLNRPIRFVNLPEAPHSFDTSHDENESREVIRQILAFMRSSVTG